MPQDLYLPAYTISAEEIFKGDILLFDVDFFNEDGEIYLKTANDSVYKVSDYEQKQLDEFIKNDGGVKNYFYKDDEGNEVITSKQNTAKEIRGVISQWYASIRNIALVLMMSVLLYIAIRMLLTTIAQDKAKYKQMMVDWVVGMCLLFFMHYIMAFSVSIVKQFIKIIDSAYSEEMDTKYFVTMENDDAEKLSKAMEEMGLSDLYQEGYITWNTNLMGQIRLQSQLTTSSTQYVGYSICFLVLVGYTVFFAFTYLKRVVYLAFLTMIAPLVALTYPIDKINDGQAQGFNKWLKEYLFNLLIQPLHLLLYTVLVLSAFEFASLNVVYMLVAIAFLIPAEKVLRSFFGFEKSETAGSLAGAAIGGGLISAGMGKLLGKGPGGNKGKTGGTKGGSDTNSSEDSPGKIGYSNNLDKYQAILNPQNSQNSSPKLGKGARWVANSREGKFIGRSVKGLGRVAGYSGKYLGARLVGKGANVLSKAPRYLANAAVAATTGTAMLAAGLMTGDAENVAKFTAAGVVGGASLANRFTDQESDGKLKNDLKKKFYGDDYEEHMNKIAAKSWKKQNEEIFEKALGKSKTKEIMKKDGNVDQYLKNGIDDAQDMIVMEQMLRDNTATNITNAMGIYAFAQQSGDMEKMKDKDRNDWKNTYTQDFKDKYNYTDAQAKVAGDKAYKGVRDFWAKKKNLKK